MSTLLQPENAKSKLFSILVHWTVAIIRDFILFINNCIGYCFFKWN
jgi:hypothetical protein